ncbi:hypothetical protein V6N11_011147 [Hibiscus sabdariffa]|uniref:Uncharacterized protein n=1 Tax=Hibiscus sabdariffa TaxID=183260 RepID=A0ABR2S7C6_9ROSI
MQEQRNKRKNPKFPLGFPIFHFGPESKDVGWLLDPVLGLPQVDSTGLPNLVTDVVETRREGGWFSLALGFFLLMRALPVLVSGRHDSFLSPIMNIGSP